MLVRVATEADVVCGVEVPAGATLWIAPWVMHRHRRYWTEPTAFLPDRFEGRPQEFSQGGPYLPFGGGPRICIGAGFALSEAEIVLSALFRRYRVTLDDDRPVTPVAVISTAPDIEPWFRLERV